MSKLCLPMGPDIGKIKRILFENVLEKPEFKHYDVPGGKMSHPLNRKIMASIFSMAGIAYLLMPYSGSICFVSFLACCKDQQTGKNMGEN